jgi:hypothetical protein
MGQPDRLRNLAAAIRGRVTSCNHFNANQGQVERRETNGKLRNYRVRIGEAISRFSLEIKGFETTRFPPEIVALVKRCLPKLRRAFPVSYELVYDYSNSVVVSFSMSERGYNCANAGFR